MEAKRSKIKRRAVWGYLSLLLCSTVFRALAPFDPAPRPNQVEIEIESLESATETIKVRYFDTYRSIEDQRPVLLLLHGSPMASRTFDNLRPHLGDYRLIIPDLPGMGQSEQEIEDYSIETHASYVARLMDDLAIDKYHVLGYSMGGGVALWLGEKRPENVQSLVLGSSIGVQEYELLGDYALNHSLHGIQLFCLWALDRFTPNFGVFNRLLIDRQYARNFYDTDLRPLQAILEKWEAPAMIVHGEQDRLVPIEAAWEHSRLMPHAALKTYPNEGHMMVFREPDRFGKVVSKFIDSVESGQARTRSQFGKEIDGTATPRPRNDSLIGALLAVATFGSEDLACIGGGLLVAKEGVSLAFAIGGCLLGIFVGDFFIYLAGRLWGPAALRVPPFRWMLDEAKVKRCSEWFDKRGALLIVSTRFVPGSRVPTYFAAGVVKAGVIRFSLALLLGAAIWTPVIVGLSAIMGAAFLEIFEAHQTMLLVAMLVFVVGFLLLIRLALALSTWRGRRLLYSKYLRIVRWEFWPTWVLYPPVVGCILWLMARYRSITLCTATNPCMPASGLVFESKSDILVHLSRFGVPVARFAIVDLEAGIAAKMAILDTFIEENGLDYPIVMKPDVGQRGQGVEIVRDRVAALAFFEKQLEDTVLQEFIGGREYGVFYYRLPEEERGRVLSITDKRFTAVVGDGESSLESLILSDERAVCLAAYFLSEFEDRLECIPDKDEVVKLASLGTHCRGALFLDGSDCITPELEKAIDDMTRGVEGFHFGRYDIRVPSEEDLKQGRSLSVIELNGLTSESTNMYDPKHGLGFAYGTLFEQWRLIFKIARQNRERGIRPDSLMRVIRLIYRYLAGKSTRD